MNMEFLQEMLVGFKVATTIGILNIIPDDGVQGGVHAASAPMAGAFMHASLATLPLEIPRKLVFSISRIATHLLS